MIATILVLVEQNLIFILVWANVLLNSIICLGWLKFKGIHHFSYQSAE